MNDNFTMINEPPNPIEYNDLRLEGGISGKSQEAATVGLENSLYAVCIYDEETLIGMGRVIGDGGAFFQIVDIVVKPSYQGQGLAKVIMGELMNFLDQNTYPGSYVSLIADGAADKLYEQFGFNYTYPRSQGMFRKY
ncbi:ribosomal protein S18 acetylase RimI-like enzyme [Geomicrobium halophilum]|uniref:Ribosomal protein S18 acetylase RimI-like enzyme n=1 Tax=Geomicrobium halophilum TaxID=549000 RepID=A0A841PZN5_9BACL|nr:GNAT family N-acetyltransferase [Geomicrobium halophilum]MBB6448218.1 ribosomal protein S18 acetylase RimI-like enzyme [Geomicrobium halophilum]